MSKTFSEQIDKNFDVIFFLDFLLFYRVFWVFLSDESSKTLQKTFYKKNVSKNFYKQIGGKPKTDFSSVLFLTSLGVSR
jgi:hypothetical protein